MPSAKEDKEDRMPPLNESWGNGTWSQSPRALENSSVGNSVQTPPSSLRNSQRRVSNGSLARSTTSEICDWSHLNAGTITLDLSNQHVKVDHLLSLVDALLTQCPALLTVNLSNCHLGTKGMEKLQRLLAAHPTLQNIHLARNGLKGGRSIRHLVAGCADNGVLRLLNISHNQLTDKAVSAELAVLLDSREVACRLTELDLSNNGSKLTDKAVWALGGALIQGNNTTLTTLKLTGNNLGPQGGDALGTLLKLSHSIEALYVANCNLGDTGVQYICQGLLLPENETALKILDIAWNVLHDDAAVALANVLESNSTLQRVQLECNGIGDKGAAALAAAFPRSPSLLSFDLRGNQIHDSGAIALAVALTDRRCQTLEVQWEMNAHMTPAGHRRIQGALQLRKSRTQWLDELLSNLEGLYRYPSLNYTIGDDEVVEICKHVATQQRQRPIVLPAVRFRGQGITLRGVKAIANQLLCPPSVTLTHLYLTDTQMGDNGADLMAQALLRNQSLTTLTCVNCQISSDGALYLSRALPRHKVLGRLDLRHNHIRSEGARALLHAITEETPNLHTLYLGKNHIGDLAVRSLFSNGQLITLHLADNYLSDAAALDLARICGNIQAASSSIAVIPHAQQQNIKHLYVCRNHLTTRGIQALKIFLPSECGLYAEPQHTGCPPDEES